MHQELRYIEADAARPDDGHLFAHRRVTLQYIDVGEHAFVIDALDLNLAWRDAGCDDHGVDAVIGEKISNKEEERWLVAPQPRQEKLRLLRHTTSQHWNEN